MHQRTRCRDYYRPLERTRCRDYSSTHDVVTIGKYGVSREFIVEGIRVGKLEYREGSVWGNPYLRVLRSQLEQYIAERMGSQHLASKKREAELRMVNREIADLKKKLTALLARKAEIEAANGN